MKIVSIIAILFCLIGCTDNERAKNFGGTATINLKAGQKLVNVSWKQDSLWILTRKAKEGESKETYELSEKSSFGMIEGTVVIEEK